LGAIDTAAVEWMGHRELGGLRHKQWRGEGWARPGTCPAKVRPAHITWSCAKH